MPPKPLILQKLSTAVTTGGLRGLVGVTRMLTGFMVGALVCWFILGMLMLAFSDTRDPYQELEIVAAAMALGYFGGVLTGNLPVQTWLIQRGLRPDERPWSMPTKRHFVLLCRILVGGAAGFIMSAALFYSFLAIYFLVLTLQGDLLVTVALDEMHYGFGAAIILCGLVAGNLQIQDEIMSWRAQTRSRNTYDR